ncbi:hypothetical protein ACFWIA_17820 [Streptomyces sp. NPDC127068]|uniref:hypothetical protein n=1 Tax=Streptomyces sp. NPDC127068 TaxID=3347127 RepID=UPI003666AC9A
MHDAYEITTLNHTAPGPAAGTIDLPPGVQIVTLPNGTRTLAYTHPAQQLPIPVTAPAPIPAWAKTTALLAPTVGGGIAAAGVGLSYATPGLIAMSHALCSAAALLVVAVIAVPVILRTTRRTPTASTQITQHVTANGLFGRANGTINHR